jgi:uncharacterized protein with FMN-binding domain
MKKKLIVFEIIVLVIILLIGGMFLRVASKQKSQLKELVYSDVDMSAVKDGSYIGNAETTLVKATVEVTVLNHKITNINITRHDNGKGKPAEVIVSDMVEQNRINIDVVSGATQSSIVIKSAVHNALIQGIK